MKAILGPTHWAKQLYFCSPSCILARKYFSGWSAGRLEKLGLKPTQPSWSLDWCWAWQYKSSLNCSKIFGWKMIIQDTQADIEIWLDWSQCSKVIDKLSIYHAIFVTGNANNEILSFQYPVMHKIINRLIQIGEILVKKTRLGYYDVTAKWT